jgi:nitrogen fixation-related uncharacterized protein
MIASLAFIGLAIVLACVAVAPIAWNLLRDLYDEDEW